MRHSAQRIVLSLLAVFVWCETAGAIVSTSLAVRKPDVHTADIAEDITIIDASADPGAGVRLLFGLCNIFYDSCICSRVLDVAPATCTSETHGLQPEDIIDIDWDGDPPPLDGPSLGEL